MTAEAPKVDRDATLSWLGVGCLFAAVVVGAIFGFLVGAQPVEVVDGRVVGAAVSHTASNMVVSGSEFNWLVALIAAGPFVLGGIIALCVSDVVDAIDAAGARSGLSSQ